MAQDHYSQWLGLAGGPRPPDAHALLGLTEAKPSPTEIEKAANRQLARLDVYAQHPDRDTRETANRLMNEVARARNTLMASAKSKRKTVTSPSTPASKIPTPETYPLPRPPVSGSQTPGRHTQRIVAGIALLLAGSGLGFGGALLLTSKSSAPTQNAQRTTLDTSIKLHEQLSAITQERDQLLEELALLSLRLRQAESTPAASEPAPEASPPKQEQSTAPLKVEKYDSAAMRAALDELLDFIADHPSDPLPDSVRLDLARRFAAGARSTITQPNPEVDSRTLATLGWLSAMLGDEEPANYLLDSAFMQVLEAFASDSASRSTQSSLDADTLYSLSTIARGYSYLNADKRFVELIQGFSSQDRLRVILGVLPELADEQLLLIQFLHQMAVETYGHQQAAGSATHAAEIADVMIRTGASYEILTEFINQYPFNGIDELRLNIAESLARYDRIEDARKLIADTEADLDNGRPDSLLGLRLAQTYMLVGESEVALDLARSIRRSSPPSNVNSDKPENQPVDWNLQIASIFADGGDWEAATIAWNGAINAARTYSGEIQPGPFSHIVAALLRYGQYDLAIQMLREETRGQHRDDLLLIVIRAFGPQIAIERIEDCVNQFNSPHRSIPSIAQMASSENNPNRQLELLAIAIRTWSQTSISDKQDEFIGLQLATAMAELSMIREAVAIAQTLPPQWEPRCLLNIVVAAADSEDHQSLHAIIRAIPSPEMRSTATLRVARRMATTNQPDAAVRFIKNAPDPIPSRAADHLTLTIAQAYIATDQLASAVDFLKQINNPSSENYEEAMQTTVEALAITREPSLFDLVEAYAESPSTARQLWIRLADTFGRPTAQGESEAAMGSQSRETQTPPPASKRLATTPSQYELIPEHVRKNYIKLSYSSLLELEQNKTKSSGYADDVKRMSDYVADDDIFLDDATFLLIKEHYSRGKLPPVRKDKND